MIKLIRSREKNNLIVVVSDLSENMGNLSLIGTIKKNAVGVFVGNDVKNQLLFDLSSIPDGSDMKNIAGLVYDFRSNESKFVAL